MKSVIYVECASQEQLNRFWQALETMVEHDSISGFFTLTVDGFPCVQDDHRADLVKLSEVISDAEAVKEGGAA